MQEPTNGALNTGNPIVEDRNLELRKMRDTIHDNMVKTALGQDEPSSKRDSDFKNWKAANARTVDDRDHTSDSATSRRNAERDAVHARAALDAARRRGY